MRSGWLAKHIQCARAVELRAGHRGQIEGIGHQVREVGVTDRLLSAIAGAPGTRAAKVGIEAIEVASGGNTRAPRHKGNPVILHLARARVRRASTPVVRGENHERVAAQGGPGRHSVEDPAEQAIGVLHGVEVLLAHESIGVPNTVG